MATCLKTKQSGAIHIDKLTRGNRHPKIGRTSNTTSEHTSRAKNKVHHPQEAVRKFTICLRTRQQLYLHKKATTIWLPHHCIHRRVVSPTHDMYKNHVQHQQLCQRSCGVALGITQNKCNWRFALRKDHRLTRVKNSHCFIVATFALHNNTAAHRADSAQNNVDTAHPQRGDVVAAEREPKTKRVTRRQHPKPTARPKTCPKRASDSLGASPCSAPGTQTAISNPITPNQPPVRILFKSQLFTLGGGPLILVTGAQTAIGDPKTTQCGM